jgi:toxin secretion/phage lysis holin
MKEIFLIVTGVIGGAIAAAFGGWNESLTTLIIFMMADYITGIIVAGVFKKSTKTTTGALESVAGWKGLCRKSITLFIVLIACRLDLEIGSNVIRDATVIAFIANEGISIIENAGLMGVPMPESIARVEMGYLEKAFASQLNSKTANAGSGKWQITKTI